MRYIHDHILQDLERKMVFIGGPRQVGKTFPAQHIQEVQWLVIDNRNDVKKIMQQDKDLVRELSNSFWHT